MTFVLAICVAVIVAVGVYMLLGGELKGVAIGVFLLAHGANLSVLAMSGSPVTADPEGGRLIKAAPVLDNHGAGASLTTVVDPLPQALILTAIVIGFGVMGFLLSLLVVTGRSTGTLDVDTLAEQQKPEPSTAH
ncbi:MAG: NADH-quinone oxidoreductase subunit K [Phycisphaeraceae bacterium]